MLIEQLPPDSALHRALNGGQVWTWQEELLWRLVQLLERNESWWRWSKGKAPKWPRHKRFPWEKDTVTLGDRGGHTSAEVIAYIESIKPKKKRG